MGSIDDDPPFSCSVDLVESSSDNAEKEQKALVIRATNQSAHIKLTGQGLAKVKATVGDNRVAHRALRETVVEQILGARGIFERLGALLLTLSLTRAVRPCHSQSRGLLCVNACCMQYACMFICMHACMYVCNACMYIMHVCVCFHECMYMFANVHFVGLS